MMNPTFLLGASLVTFAVAGALTPLVLIGLLGLLLFPCGLALAGLALRAASGRGESLEPGPGSLALFWCGVLLTAVSAFRGGALAFAVAIHRLHPGAMAPPATATAWVAGGLLALAGAALLSLGLGHCLEGAARERRRWFAASAAVFPASAGLFGLLSAHWPMAA